MHIPDGFLTPGVALATGGLGAAGLGVALRHAGRNMERRRVPLLGLTAAFVFAAQMLNFPVAGGTSGHLVGAVLAATLLGPSGGVIVMSTVLIVQCLMFADGGITALGANLVNMALVGAVGGYAIVAGVRRVVPGVFGAVLAAAFAAWCSTVAAAAACAGELAASRIVEWHIALPAMVGVHMVVGIGEALITALVVAGVGRVRPELLAASAPGSGPSSFRSGVGYGVVISLALALFGSPLASRLPDGLEHTAEALGFGGRAVGTLARAPMPEYGVRWIAWSGLGTSIAAGIGTVVAFALAWGLARALVPTLPREGERAGPGAGA